MKEDDFKKILEKSKLETSDSFVDSLMYQIELEPQYSQQLSKRISFKPILILCGILAMIISVVSYYFINNLTKSHIDIKSIAIPAFITLFGTLLFVLNNFIKTLELYTHLTNKPVLGQVK